MVLMPVVSLRSSEVLGRLHSHAQLQREGLAPASSMKSSSKALVKEMATTRTATMAETKS